MRLVRRPSGCCRLGLPGACLLLALWQTGCANLPEYPSQLPALSPAQKKFGVCPVIAGRYADKGSAFSTKGEPLGKVSLSQLVHGNRSNPDTGLADADVVVVLGPEDRVLELQSWREGRQVDTMKWRGDFRYSNHNPYICQWGFVTLFPNFQSSGAGSDESLRLRKAADGSLIVLHHKETVDSLPYMVPVPIVDNKWYQFPPTVESH